MQRYLVLSLSLLFLSLHAPFPAYAHSESQHSDKTYEVKTEQTPLSPFVGEEVTVTFTLTDKQGIPVKALPGNLVIKKITATQFTNKTSEQQEDVIMTQPGKTDAEGNVSLTYTFSHEGLYDTEFIWGSDPEEDSAGKEVFAREPTSYFLPKELMKRMWLFIGIAFGGIVIGSVGTFILLTARLHKRK